MSTMLHREKFSTNYYLRSPKFNGIWLKKVTASSTADRHRTTPLHNPKYRNLPPAY